MMQPPAGAVPPPMDQNQQVQQYGQGPPPPQQPWMMMPPPQQAGQVPAQMWPQQHPQVPPQHYQAAAPVTNQDEVRSLWIGDLQIWMDENYLWGVFAPGGEVTNVKIIRNKQTGQPEGYGFIEFGSRVSAERVLSTYNGVLMPSTEIPFRLNWATLGAGQKRQDDSPDYPIFVGDLAADVTDYTLQETFRAHYSSVKGAKVITDHSTGRSKGYGFVRFGDESEQLRAMTEMSGMLCSSRPDRSMIAFCPNNEEVHIYGKLDGKWEKIHVLQKHDQIVSGIDWSAKSNRIVTVSHDRNSYVWNLESSEWVPTLVILRLNRAALCTQWSPLENKFAVGSGAKTVCICYYEQENNWWVSKLIRKRHNSSVTGVAWHPNNKLLATTSTDGKCRVFSTFIKGVDPKDLETKSSDSKFGEQIIQLDLSSSWAFGVKWSPSGNTLAYVGHNSMIYFVDDVGPSPLAQNVALRDLPLRDVLFVSEKMVIGVGYDCNPMVFAADESGLWNFVKCLDERRTATPSNARQGSQISEAFGKLYGQSRYSFNNDGFDNFKPHGSIHENCINCIVPLKKSGDSNIKRFSTSGLDGKVAVWDLSNDQDLAEYM